MNDNNLGKRIKETRLELHFTCEDLANRVGLSKSAISRIENGIVKNPKLAIISSIADALKVNPAWIIGKDPNKYLVPNNLIDILYEIISFNLNDYYTNGDRKLNTDEKKMIDVTLNLIIKNLQSGN